MSSTDNHMHTRGPQHWLKLLASGARHIAALALLALVAVQGWQVFARYVLNDSPGWTEPLTMLLLSIAMSMGAAAAVHGNTHFGFFLLGERLGPKGSRVLQVVVEAIVAVIGAQLAWWGWVLWMDGMHIKTAGADFPQSVNDLPLSIGGALMVVFALNRLVLAVWPKTAAGEH